MADSIAEIQQQWSGYRQQVVHGRLTFRPGAALNAVRATHAALGWVLAVQQRLRHIRVADINRLTSGIRLAGQFNSAAANLDLALRAHGRILEQMAQTISAAGKAYPGADEDSAAAFDKLKPSLPYIGKTEPPIVDGPGSRDSPKPWYRQDRPLGTHQISAEPPQGMSWSALHALTAMNAVPIRDAGAEWRAMSAKLKQAFAKLGTDISAAGRDWEGAGHTRLKEAVDIYLECTKALTDSMTLMGENLLSTAQWLDWTRTRMPPIPHPPTESMHLKPVDSTIGTVPTYGPYQIHRQGGDRTIAVLADGELYVGSPYNVGVALTNHYRWNFWNWYVRGIYEATRNVPRIPLPAGQAPGPRKGTPRGGGPGKGGPQPRPRTDPPRRKPKPKQKLDPGGPRPTPRPGQPGPRQTPQPGQAPNQGMQAAQQALQAMQQAGQMRPAAAVPPGPAVDPAKAGLGVPGKFGGGPGPGPGGAPLGQNPLLPRESAQAKLFPRAGLAADGTAAPGRPSAAPVAGAPGAPGAPMYPPYGAGHGNMNEHKRAEYLASADYLDEGLGAPPNAVTPVTGE